MTTREITPETGALGSRTLQDQGDTRLTAIARAAGAFLAELWRAWAAARYAYRKARKTSRPYSAKLPVGDPIPLNDHLVLDGHDPAEASD